MMDAFDADVLIYAAVADHELGEPVRALFRSADDSAGVGSVFLLPEILSKPLREGAHDEVAELAELIGRLVLRPVDAATAELATGFGALYGLAAGDAVHLATAVNAGADRFITNNSRDFSTEISEIEITLPEDLDC
jgi:predicted nucleic acid-binding protein